MIRGLRHNRSAIIAYVLVLIASVLAAVLSAQQATSEARHSVEALAVRIAQENRENQLRGCERSKADRLDAVRGWTIARKTRLATANNRQVPMRERLSAAAAAAVYKQVIEGYSERVVDCNQAFPPVRTAIVNNAIRLRDS